MALFDIFRKKRPVETDASLVEAEQGVGEAQVVDGLGGDEAQSAVEQGLQPAAGSDGGPTDSSSPDTGSKEALSSGLEKTRTGLFSKLSRAVAGRSTVDAAVLDDLEEVLVSSDVGVDTTVEIIRRIEERVRKDKYMNTSELQGILREEIAALLEESEGNFERDGVEGLGAKPYVLMVVGVNGVGKTTTIGKLAAKLSRLGKKVYIGAADTFRAAAIDQLEVWARRAGASGDSFTTGDGTPVAGGAASGATSGTTGAAGQRGDVVLVKQQMGSDPASVAFDTLKSAAANGADVVIIDTAGRLHNKVGLMNELSKIRAVMAKVIPDAPHEVMLVLDGSTGQNAFEQAKEFTAATKVNSLAITKLDGTAKGGVVIGISHRFGVPVRWIGIGEGIDDLRPFDRTDFVNALFS